MAQAPRLPPLPPLAQAPSPLLDEKVRLIYRELFMTLQGMENSTTTDEQLEQIIESFKQAYSNCRSSAVSPASLLSLLNARDSGGRGLFHYACLHGILSLLEFLLSEAVELNERDGQGQSGLHLILKAPHRESAEKLLKQEKVETIVADEFQRLPLHWACAAGLESDILDRLLLRPSGSEPLDARQVVNWPTLSGDSPLHWAVLEGRVATVAWLLSKGADPKTKNSRGFSPLDNAKQVASVESREILENRLNEEIFHQNQQEAGNAESSKRKLGTEFSYAAAPKIANKKKLTIKLKEKS